MTPNFPARFRPSDIIEFGSDKKVRHTLPNIGLIRTFMGFGSENPGLVLIRRRLGSW